MNQTPSKKVADFLSQYKNGNEYTMKILKQNCTR